MIMSQVTKNFWYNLLIVLISAVLSFLVGYVQQHLTPVETGAIGGGFATVGVALKRTFCLV